MNPRILAAFVLFACNGTSTEPPVQADTDTDADADTDTDADADTDTDPQPVWSPTPGTTWHWQLQGTVSTTLTETMVDLDLFDTPVATIDALRAGGHTVICYFSAGSREDWRSDASAFPAATQGSPLDGWPGEVWVDIRSQAVRDVMTARMDLAVTKHCDGVEPDNVDAYANNSGFPLTQADQIAFDTFLATEAHARGLSVGLKNAVELVPTLEPLFDWALNEECLDYDECDTLQPFLTANKAVFHVEYVDDSSDGPALHATVCADPSRSGFSTLIKTWDLDAWGMSCP